MSHAVTSRRAVAPKTIEADKSFFVELAVRAVASGEIEAEGAFLAVPDVILLEGVANGGRLPTGAGTVTLRGGHDDGRRVAFFRAPRTT